MFRFLQNYLQATVNYRELHLVCTVGYRNVCTHLPVVNIDLKMVL